MFPVHVVFTDRREAGRMLAGLLRRYRDRDDVAVLGLPRGGLPVGWEVATRLHAPIDALVVRKLGVPGHEEYALGAIASGGHIVIDDDLVQRLRITPQQLMETIERERRELARRESTYRTHDRTVEIADKTVILVDDGIATGCTMRAAVRMLRTQAPRRIVVAVPVAPKSVRQLFGGTVDELVVVSTPVQFVAVGDAYQDFHQVSDDEVHELLGAPKPR